MGTASIPGYFSVSSFEFVLGKLPTCVVAVLEGYAPLLNPSPIFTSRTGALILSAALLVVAVEVVVGVEG
jgi:hypothetical protein